MFQILSSLVLYNNYFIIDISLTICQIKWHTRRLIGYNNFIRFKILFQEKS